MKRAVLVGAGTAAGLAAVLLLNPTSQKTLQAAGATPSAPADPSSGSGTSGDASGGSTPGGSTPGGSSAGGSSGGNGTYDGDTVQTRWGPVQVQITVTDARITDVQALRLPDGDQRSYAISEQVAPLLREQALAAQSAQIDGVSGATYTSSGYQQSLASALSRAGL